MADPIREALERLLAADDYIHVASPEYVQAREAARATLAAAPPAPAPAADGEREELAQWLDGEARSCAAQFHDRITRAAALLRQLAPAPVPDWQPIDTAPQDGTEILASDYDAIEIVSWSWDAWETGSGWVDRNGQRLFPAWWQPLPDHPPIPQPPQCGEVES